MTSMVVCRTMFIIGGALSIVDPQISLMFNANTASSRAEHNKGEAGYHF